MTLNINVIGFRGYRYFLSLKIKIKRSYSMPFIVKQRTLSHELFCDINHTYLPYSVSLTQPPFIKMYANFSTHLHMGAQWLSGRVLDSGPRGRRLKPHRRHCIIVLEQDIFILA